MAGSKEKYSKLNLHYVSLVIPCLSSLQIRRRISKIKNSTIQKIYETDAISVNTHSQDIKLISTQPILIHSLNICCTNSAYQVVSQRSQIRATIQSILLEIRRNRFMSSLRMIYNARLMIQENAGKDKKKHQQHTVHQRLGNYNNTQTTLAGYLIQVTSRKHFRHFFRF